MAGQPFHRMAPVPPHLSYRPEISTYMDHFRKPLPPPRRRNVLPAQFLMRSRGHSAANDYQKENQPLTDKSLIKQQMRKAKVKTTVKDYMDEMLKMTDNSFPAYNARVDVPCKTAQPNKTQRTDLKRISRAGFGISDNEARDIVRKDRSVDFYHQHQIEASHLKPTRPIKSAPPLKMNTNKASKDCSNEPHWMSWNSGTPEPPGLQKRLHRPWPTPEPPRVLEDYRCSSRNTRPYSAVPRPNSAVPRPASRTLLPTNPTNPVPDMIGSEGTHPILTKDREQVYTPQPDTLPQCLDDDAIILPNFQQFANSGDYNCPETQNTSTNIQRRPHCCEKVKPPKVTPEYYNGTLLPNGCVKTDRLKHGDVNTKVKVNIPMPKALDSLKSHPYSKAECIKVDRDKGIPAWQSRCYNKQYCLGSRYPFDTSEPQYHPCYTDCKRAAVTRSPKPAEIIQDQGRIASRCVNLARGQSASPKPASHVCKENAQNEQEKRKKEPAVHHYVQRPEIQKVKRC